MSNNKVTYLVYIHISKINNKKYIGITSNEDPNKRWQNGNGYRDCPRFFNHIKKYGWDSLEHKVLYTNLSKEEAEKKEIELIKLYNSTNKKYGFNISNGGSLSGKHTKETKLKISKNHANVVGKNNPNHNSNIKHVRPKWHLAKETKEKIRKSRLGKKMSEETKQKIREKQLNKIKSQETKNKISTTLIELKINCKKVYQYDISDNYIKCWDSITLASKTLNINLGSISNCCHNRQHTAGGFKWLLYKI